MGLLYNHETAVRKPLNYSNFDNEYREDMQSSEIINPQLIRQDPPETEASDYRQISDSDSATGDVGCSSRIDFTYDIRIDGMSVTAGNSGSGVLVTRLYVNGILIASISSASDIIYDTNMYLDTTFRSGDSIEVVADGGLSPATTTNTGIGITGFRIP